MTLRQHLWRYASTAHLFVCTLCSLLTNCLQAVDEHQVRHNEITASKDDLASLAQATDRVVSRGLMAEVCLTACLHSTALQRP